MGIPVGFKKKAVEGVARYLRADIFVSAAALGFHSLLGIVPAAAVGFWYLERMGATAAWREEVRSYLLSYINVLSSEKVAELYDFLTLASRGQTWSTIGMLLLGYSAFNVFYAFWVSLDRVIASRAVHGDTPSHRGLGLKFALRSLAMLGIPVALVLSLIAGQWAREDSFLHAFVALPYIGSLYVEGVSVLVNLGLFFLVYLLVPSYPVTSKHALKAAAVTVVLLFLGRWGITAYFKFAFSTQRLYGVFSTIPMTIFWVQLLWTIILSSALVLRSTEQGVPRTRIKRNKR